MSQEDGGRATPGTVLPRRFALRRRVDVSGVSGAGLVAFGTVYPGGRTTLAWCAGDVSSVTVYDSPEQVERIHGHHGSTVLVWIDAAVALVDADDGRLMERPRGPGQQG